MIARQQDYQPYRVQVQVNRNKHAQQIVEALLPHITRASILGEIQELELRLQGARNQAALTRKPDVANDCYVEAAGLHFKLAELFMALLPAERRGEVE